MGALWLESCFVQLPPCRGILSEIYQRQSAQLSMFEGAIVFTLIVLSFSYLSGKSCYGCARAEC